MALEIDLNGNRYSIGKLSAKQQFHVSRRIAPILPTMIPIFLRIKESGVNLTDDLDGMAQILQPFADGIAAMRDEDADYVIDACLSAVQRKQDAGWFNVMGSTKQLMFQDIDLGVMLPLAVRVIVENLGPFIQGLLTSQAGSPEATQAG